MSPVVGTGTDIPVSANRRRAQGVSAGQAARTSQDSGRVTNYLTKIFSSLRLVVILLSWQVMTGFELKAQGFFLGVRTSPTNAILVNSTLTYTIGLTNLLGFDANAILVTNTLPASVQIIGVTPPAGTTVFTNGSSLEFFINTIPTGFTAVMTVTARPTTPGSFTNRVTAFFSQLPGVLSTNVVSQATNPVVQADLEVLLAGPPQPAFPGDWTAYVTGVTNHGPNTATNIFVTNTLPAGAKFLSVSPASQPFTLLSSNRVSFPVTSLTNHAFRSFRVQLQLPTNSGTALFSAAVTQTGAADTNAAHNTAATNVLVSGYSSAPLALLAVTNSAQFTNRQNGLIEQKILVSNVGTAAVDSVRVILTGLTNVPLAGFTNYLFNATGTNGGNPFVTYAATLNTNESVELLLQFSARTRSTFPFANSQLHAFGVSPPDLTPPTGAAASTNLNFTRIFPLANGDMFLEFKSTLGRVYTIVYSDNMAFSNAVMAVPPMVAPANYVQWTDYGPPATLSKPGSGTRFYRVFLNP